VLYDFDFTAAFITGTDTGVGKTHVTLELAKRILQQHKKLWVLKPVATGCIRQNNHLYSEDYLRYKSLDNPNFSIYEGFTFKEPVSPNIAASLAKIELSAQKIAAWCQDKISSSNANVLLEGAGGLLVPLNNTQTWVDVLQLLQIPIILVVGIKLGCLNHALLSSYVIEANKLPFMGWIANKIDPFCLYPEKIIETLEQKISAKYLGYFNVKTSHSACCII